MVRHREIARATRPTAKEPSPWADIWELAWIPATLAILAILLTWAVWYHTTEPGKPDATKPTGCSYTELENCISLDLLNKMFTHGAIAGGIGGVAFYIMLRKERQAREAAERRAERAERRVDATRRQADIDHQRLIERILELSAHPRSGQEQTTSE